MGTKLNEKITIKYNLDLSGDVRFCTEGWIFSIPGKLLKLTMISLIGKIVGFDTNGSSKEKQLITEMDEFGNDVNASFYPDKKGNIIFNRSECTIRVPKQDLIDLFVEIMRVELGESIRNSTPNEVITKYFATSQCLSLDNGDDNATVDYIPSEVSSEDAAIKVENSKDVLGAQFAIEVLKVIKSLVYNELPETIFTNEEEYRRALKENRYDVAFIRKNKFGEYLFIRSKLLRECVEWNTKEWVAARSLLIGNECFIMNHGGKKPKVCGKNHYCFDINKCLQTLSICENTLHTPKVMTANDMEVSNTPDTRK